MCDSRFGEVHLSDNLEFLRQTPDATYSLVYIDPPFNTGTCQQRTRIKTMQSEDGDRVGFGDRRYITTEIGTMSFSDTFDDYLEFLQPRLEHAHRVLTESGSLYFHIDYREVHYCKILLDSIFGRERFLNEIIWAYDFGGKAKRRWPPKHDNILVYVKDPHNYTFNVDSIERIPYMAPGLAGIAKAKQGKLPTDTWWHTIVPTNGSERTGYPTQKPLGILRRIVLASSNPGERVLDFFAGSGTTGAACLETGRRFTLVDSNPDALIVMAKRFASETCIAWHGFDPTPYQQEAKQSRLFMPVDER